MAKLGAVQPQLTFSQLINHFDLDSSKGQAMPLYHCFPSNYDSKTADVASFTEINASMSATDAQAPKGRDELERCGRTALPSTI